MVAGSSNQPSINGLYTCKGDRHEGFDVYANSDSSLFLFWISRYGGKWLIAEGFNPVKAVLARQDDDTALTMKLSVPV